MKFHTHDSGLHSRAAAAVHQERSPRQTLPATALQKGLSITMGILTGCACTLFAKPVQAFTFQSSYVTPASVLDFTRLGYTYDYGYTNTFDVLPASAAQTTGLAVRKNAADLTQTEIDKFINALLTLKRTMTTTDNGLQISIYDRFVATHIATGDIAGRSGPGGITLANAAHNGSAFLPWHRQFLYEFEKALQSVDPTVTIPFWDWTNSTATYNKIFQNNFMGPDGTGGTNSIQVMSGYFSLANGWGLRTDLNRARWNGINATLQPLTRDLAGRITSLGTVAQATNALAATSYATFRSRLEAGTGMHNNMHGWIGGFGGTISNVGASPNDPMFWLLHANVDRIWAEWQLNGHWGSSFYPSTGQSYGHNLNDPMFPWDGGIVSAAADLQDILPNLPGTGVQSVLNGNTTVGSSFTNTSVVSPGNSPGMISILGDYVQDALGELTIEIGGLTSGTEYDQLTVDGTAFLDGVLNLYFLGEFEPTAGDTFNFLVANDVVGEFSKINVFGLDTAYNFDLIFKDGVYSLIALGADATAAGNGFATTPDDLLNDDSGNLYNPAFGMGADHYCYGQEMHHGWSTEDDAGMGEDGSMGEGDGMDMGEGDGMSGGMAPDEYLPLDMDGATLCEQLLAYDMGEDPDSETVPEPTSALALITLGFLGLGSRLHRTRS